MATKIAVAQKRMFDGVFVCKDCNKKIRAQSVKITAGKITCPRCKGKAFRPMRRKK
mgnify:CR=1 FL=1